MSGASGVTSVSPVNLKVERSSPVRPSPILVSQLLDFDLFFAAFGILGSNEMYRFLDWFNSVNLL